MIASVRDVLVLTRADFERLPDDGRWEIADGAAVLLPPANYTHQKLSDGLVSLLRTRLAALGNGLVCSAAGVFVPRRPGQMGEIQYRTPDIVVSRREPEGYFEAGDPPELVIEILSTARGNVERTEKMDDYARAGIGEYWIVDPFQRLVEVYRLEQGEYARMGQSQERLRPAAFPWLEVDLRQVWAVFG